MVSKPRVGTTTSLAPAQLSTYYRNARRGDVDAIAASLRVHGQYKPLIANIGTSTGRPFEVLGGNHTLMAIRDLAEKYPDDERWQSVLVHWLDVDNDNATRINLVDNQLNTKGGYDNAALLDLVQSLGDDLAGTGFDAADLDALEAAANPSTDDDIDDNPAGSDDVTTVWGVVVECENETQQIELLEQLADAGHNVKALM